MLYALCSAAQIWSPTVVQGPPAGKQFPLSECLIGQILRSTMKTLPLQILPGNISEQHLVRNQDVPNLDGGNLVGRDVQRVPKFQSDTRAQAGISPPSKGLVGTLTGWPFMKRVATDGMMEPSGILLNPRPSKTGRKPTLPPRCA